MHKVYHKITLLEHGTVAGTPPMHNRHARAKRSNCSGWSDASARSNTKFLQTVALDGLTGFGVALTLTVKTCPETHADWHKIRDSFFKRMLRMGCLRYHWVTEWQTRGVPHLHGIVYFPESDDPMESVSKLELIKKAWIEQTGKKYGSAIWGQHVAPITNALGWIQYTAKHAARGCRHYQRSNDSIPEGWKKTGRMWGYGGDWKRSKPVVYRPEGPAFYAYRRLFRSWYIARCRDIGTPANIARARALLKCPDRSLSEVRGVSNWCGQSVTMRMIDYLIEMGYEIYPEPDPQMNLPLAEPQYQGETIPLAQLAEFFDSQDSEPQF